MSNETQVKSIKNTVAAVNVMIPGVSNPLTTVAAGVARSVLSNP